MGGSGGRRPAGNLPAEVGRLIGRRREASEVKRLLSAGRLVTLTGVGGVGKTRLALRVAADVTRAFPDGVWLVQLAELADPGLLPQTVGAALGMRDRSAAPTTARLAEYLGRKRLLLVLDNCEHLTDACAALVSGLLRAAPGLRVLATSRQLLRVAGEHLFEVPPLSVPAADGPMPPGELLRYEAVGLFADRAAAAMPGFEVTAANAAMVARICRLLDGIPLAIELAAVLPRSMPVEEIVERLDDRFRLLGRGSRAELPRHRTLRALIDWSHDLCSPAERTLWRRLSVFAGGFELAAAEEIASGGGIIAEDIAELIAGLVDKSIIGLDAADGRRYRMLETIRQYGAERLAASPEGPGPVRARHRDHYRRLAAASEAEFFGPRQTYWGARLSAEHANLRAAVEHSLSEPGPASAAMAIAASLWQYWIFASGRISEGRGWLDRTLARDRGPGPLRTKALWVGAWLAMLQGDLAAGLALLDECRDAAERIADEGALAHVAQISGLSGLHQDDLGRASSLFEEALARYRARDDVNGVWTTLYQLTVAESMRDPEYAAALGERGVDLCESHRAPWSKSFLLFATAFAWWLRGDRARTAALLREALHIKRRFYDPWGSGHCLALAAWLAEARGEHRRAAGLLGAVQMVEELMGASPTRLWYWAAFHDPCAARTRRMMGEAAFATAFRRGAGLSLDEAVAFALSEGPAEPAVPAEPAREELADLTPREREVAELVAQGMSNKEIATALVIAPRTAEGHIEHILAKLGFSSRAQIAAWVTKAHDTTESSR